MAFNVNNTGVNLKTFFKTSNQTLPAIGYQNNGTALTNFALYMFGTRTRCNYQHVGTDLSTFYQQDAFNNSFDLGAYNMTPWNLTNTIYQNARWIWASATANIDASGNLDGKYYWFYYTFYYNGSNTSGTLYLSCDNNAVAFFNSNSVLTLANDDVGNFNGVNSVSITLIPNGLNYIRIAAYNSGNGNTGTGSGGNVVTLTNGSTSTNGSNTLYTFSSNGSITFSSALSVKLLIVGGGGSAGSGGFATGGGGGGNVFYSSDYSVSGTYNISIGQGGQASLTSGGSSSFGSLTILGGGYGGTGSNIGGNGGNGGGGHNGTFPSYNGGTGTIGSATYGGLSGARGGNGGGGGGGGAGGAAFTGGNQNGGLGGPGISISIGGTTNTYGAGGKAAKLASTATGIGSGGNSTGSSISGTNGIVIISVTSSGTNNPAGLICSVRDSSADIANSNSDWAYSLSTTAGTSTTSNYSTSGANALNSLS
jgi:hypothetical protein